MQIEERHRPDEERWATMGTTNVAPLDEPQLGRNLGQARQDREMAWRRKLFELADLCLQVQALVPGTWKSGEAIKAASHVCLA
jgi:hypothetical protein